MRVSSVAAEPFLLLRADADRQADVATRTDEGRASAGERRIGRRARQATIRATRSAGPARRASARGRDAPAVDIEVRAKRPEAHANLTGVRSSIRTGGLGLSRVDEGCGHRSVRLR